MANLNLVQAINLALIQEMEKNPNIVLLGEDIGVNGGVFRVTAGLHEEFGDANFMAFAAKIRPLIAEQQNKLMLSAPWGPQP